MRKLVVSLLMLSCSAFAGPKEQAYRLHNRIAGVPPTPAVHTQMETMIATGNPIGAANLAMQSPYFYNLTLKNWAKGWTNEEESVRVPLNDYVATVIGIVRDNIPFDSVLYADIIYTGQNGLNNVAAYSASDNQHYIDMEDQKLDLSSVLTQRTQSQMNGIADTAGVLTTRAAGEAFYQAGTNRAVTRYTFMHYLCHDFEQLHDITIPDVYVRKDVDRKPGGDSRTYKNKCVGCHAGQDALGGAWSYFDFVDGALVHTPGQVVDKINALVLFSDGRQVTNDSWLNLWNTGQNTFMGWRGPQNGSGARSFGMFVTKTKAFSQCMAKKAYKLVCLTEPNDSMMSAVNNLADEFENNGSFNMKNLIAKSSTLCLGE